MADRRTDESGGARDGPDAARDDNERDPSTSTAVVAVTVGGVIGLFVAWAVHPLGGSILGLPPSAWGGLGAGIVGAGLLATRPSAYRALGLGLDLLVVPVLARPLVLYYPTFLPVARGEAPLAVDSLGGLLLSVLVAVAITIGLLAASDYVDRRGERALVHRAREVLRGRGG